MKQESLDMIYKVNTFPMKMTIKSKKKIKGFTLVELLVVIVIIGSLAALLSPSVLKAIEKGKKTKSQTHLRSLVSAVEGYHSDYSVYPDANNPAFTSGTVDLNIDTGDIGLVTDDTNNATVQALCAEENVPTINNRNTRYLDNISLNKSGNAGIDYTTFAFIDWKGNPYQLVWDANYDGMLAHPTDATQPDLRMGVIGAGEGMSDVGLDSTDADFLITDIVTTW